MAFILIFIIFELLAVADFVVYLGSKERMLDSSKSFVLDGIVIVLFPLLYLSTDGFGVEYISTSGIGVKNACLYPSITFSLEHRLSIILLLIVSAGSYFVSQYKKAVSSPVLELLKNTLLINGILLHIAIMSHIQYSWVFILPIILLYLMALMGNHQLILDQMVMQTGTPSQLSLRFIIKVLKLPFWQKTPILMFLCLPVLLLFSLILLLWGQKPDSLIKAFTETYYHGFSQLNYAQECPDMKAGGHYLCSVAAKGHAKVVKPIRMGERLNQPIICNRQLLIANAFEELLQEKLPRLHQFCRNQYNKVGRFIHQYYSVFEIKWISDTIYFLMKPLEWFFLLTLYTFDLKPENRIESQYINKAQKSGIRRLTQ